MNYLTLAAVAPGLFLLFYVNKQDKIEREPFGLLLKLVFFGALCVIPALLLEFGIEYFLPFGPYEVSTVYLLVDNFIIIACSEEGCKLLFLKLGSWKKPAFNFTFDGVVYAVCVGAGFAICENLLYVMDGGLGIAALRALTAVPAHVVFAIYMGFYYGMAKFYSAHNNSRLSRQSMVKAFIVPVLLHGFYDYTATVGQVWSLVLYIGFVIVIDILAYKKLKAMSATDMPVEPFYPDGPTNI